MLVLHTDVMANAFVESSMDMIMLALHNSREREQKEWVALFAEADKRFRFESVDIVEGNVAAVMVFEWKE